MNRRTFLAASTATGVALAGASALAQPQAGRHVVVIGAGIIGSSIAWHLAAAGVKVTVLEAERPSIGATENSFAWLNAANKRPREYHTLNLLGILGWRRLQAQLGERGPSVQWGGCVDWVADEAAAARMREQTARKQAWGYSIRMIEAGEVRALLPHADPGKVVAAAFTDVEGTVNPKLANEALLAAAKALGAKVEYPVRVTGFDSAGGRVTRVLTSKGAIAVDDVVIAAGLGSQELAAMLGANVPLHSEPGVLAHTAPMPLILPRLAYGPGANIKQNPDGSIVSSPSFAGAPDVPATREVGMALLAQAARYVPEINDAKLDWVSMGHRVLPKDGLPIVGHLGSRANAYVAAMHSGLTMAPLIGQLAAVEILDGPKADLLATFRPARFTA